MDAGFAAMPKVVEERIFGEVAAQIAVRIELYIELGGWIPRLAIAPKPKMLEGIDVWRCRHVGVVFQIIFNVKIRIRTIAAGFPVSEEVAQRQLVVFQLVVLAVPRGVENGTRREPAFVTIERIVKQWLPPGVTNIFIFAQVPRRVEIWIWPASLEISMVEEMLEYADLSLRDIRITGCIVIQVEKTGLSQECQLAQANEFVRWFVAVLANRFGKAWLTAGLNEECQEIRHQTPLTARAARSSGADLLSRAPLAAEDRRPGAPFESLAEELMVDPDQRDRRAVTEFNRVAAVAHRLAGDRILAVPTEQYRVVGLQAKDRLRTAGMTGDEGI